VIIVSHRGPSSFTADGHGGFTARRGAGGLVSALASLLDGTVPGSWIAAAISADDVAAARSGRVAEIVGADVRLLTVDEATHRLHYDVVSNTLLWYMHHGLFGLGHDPTFDVELHGALDAYRAVNEAFAIAVCDAAPTGDVVLVHDYQLALVPAMVRARRPDLRVQIFTHTPFCGPETIRVLPDDFARELLTSMAGGPAGFHSTRWASAFAASAREVLGSHIELNTFVAPLGPDPDALRADALSARVDDELRALEAIVGDRAVLLRADRIEPSKNIVRGFVAFDRFLERFPEWLGRAVFVAMLNPSRQSLQLYRDYSVEVRDAAQRVNERWSTDDWQPVVIDERDDFARTLAGYRRADVVFVNPVRDGLNLVAKEAPIVNERDAVLCLSREAGAHDELVDACLTLQPFDVEQQAGVIAQALLMPAPERASRATALRAAAQAVTPVSWLATLVGHA
jgi:trehalose 6-phosphate synthase